MGDLTQGLLVVQLVNFSEMIDIDNIVYDILSEKLIKLPDSIEKTIVVDIDGVVYEILKENLIKLPNSLIEKISSWIWESLLRESYYKSVDYLKDHRDLATNINYTKMFDFYNKQFRKIGSRPDEPRDFFIKKTFMFDAEDVPDDYAGKIETPRKIQVVLDTRYLTKMGGTYPGNPIKIIMRFDRDRILGLYDDISNGYSGEDKVLSSLRSYYGELREVLEHEFTHVMQILNPKLFKKEWDKTVDMFGEIEQKAYARDLYNEIIKYIDTNSRGRLSSDDFYRIVNGYLLYDTNPVKWIVRLRDRDESSFKKIVKSLYKELDKEGLIYDI